MLYQFKEFIPVKGKDTYVSETAMVIGNVEIGNNCYIGHGAIIRGDYGRIVIEDGTAVEEGVIIHAPPGCTGVIGKRVTIGHGAVLHGKVIKDNAVIGMGAVLSLFSELGENSIVAEGAIVKMNQKIEDNVVVAGNPASVVREVLGRDKEMWGVGKQLYIDLAKEYLEHGMIPVKEE